MSQVQPEQEPVLVVGGGLVGLSAALFFQRHRVPHVLVERNATASPLPRARGIAVRTMELFRQVGLQDAIEEAAKSAWHMGAFGGGRRGPTMLSSEALAIPESGKHLKGGDPSPCQMTACPQTLVEPVLRRALEDRGGDARFGWELVGFAQDDKRVTATMRDPAGVERTIAASYLLAADGSRGGVRRHLGIGREGANPGQHFLNVFFEADLTDHVRGRTFSQCQVDGEIRGLFLSMNNTTQWSFHLLHDFEVDQPEAWSDDEVARRVQAAIGADVPVTIRHRSSWSAGVRIAGRYRQGRVFLAGDAAHAMPPWGGFNANTGIADVHNLAWKLAAVMRGEAPSALLDSYEAERRPVAARNGEQSLLRTDLDARFGIRTDANGEVFDRMIDGGALLMRYRYGEQADTVEALHGQSDTRFPHAWIAQNGDRRSTLDLFGDGPVSLAGPAAMRGGINRTYRATEDFTFVDSRVTWRTLTGCRNDEIVHIRPDGFVAPDSAS